MSLVGNLGGKAQREESANGVFRLPSHPAYPSVNASKLGEVRLIYSKHTITSDDGDHQWAVVSQDCDVNDDNDDFVAHAVKAIRTAYGEEELRAMVDDEVSSKVPEPAESVANDFGNDVIRAFRSSLPNPEVEGKKPEHLSNFRSETSEIVARAALSVVYGCAVPPALHATKGNRNQPVLGFDGWSVMETPGDQMALVLLQVKATNDNKRPPAEAKKLITECGRAITDIEKLKGYLMACIKICKGTPYAFALMRMAVELETTKKLSNIILAPVIMRGTLLADIEDLKSLREAKSQYLHAKARGMTLSIGTDLTEFGRTVMNRARQHD